VLCMIADPTITSFDVKHPLESTWVLYFDYPPSTNADPQKDWFASLHKIYEISTIEDFWAVYNNIADASGIVPGSTYHFFKAGIKPMWEDPTNRNGGKWLLSPPSSNLSLVWEETLLAMVGEQFDEFGNEVCGAVMARRSRGDKISLWTKTASDAKACLEIGKIWLSSLSATDKKLQLTYQVHADSMRAGSSYSNASRYNLTQ